MKKKIRHRPIHKPIDLYILAGDKVGPTQKLEFLFQFMGRGENAGYQLFLLFATLFLNVTQDL